MGIDTIILWHDQEKKGTLVNRAEFIVRQGTVILAQGSLFDREETAPIPHA